ncbi:MAG: hypothetical protein GX537_05400 [Actinobacteria bacterium]|nr:hypothetical protein [Actinomycetota bacterium]
MGERAVVPAAPGATGREARVSIEAVMARLAGGDGAAIQSLIEGFRPELVRSVRTIASSRNLRLSAEQLDALVVDAALAISDVAPAWKPGGAPPWFYAKGRIANAVDREIGQWANELDDERTDVEEKPAVAGTEPDTYETLLGLASVNHDAARFIDALASVASVRDQMLFVEHGVQVSLGDPSPAVTVGQQFGMNPAAVRQQTRRIRLRLKDLADSDPRYRELAALDLVA